MSIAGSQQRTLLELLAALRPHWHRDRNLPARIQNALARQRAFGARDRRLYRELIYTALRYLPWIEPNLDEKPAAASELIAWLAADSRVTERFRTTVNADWPPCPPTVKGKVDVVTRRPDQSPEVLALLAQPAAGLLPAWFQAHCPPAFQDAEIDALATRAPLWLRIQTDDTGPIVEEFRERGWSWRTAPALETAWRIEEPFNVTNSRAFERGLFEVQDLGSQLLLPSCGLGKGGRWLDACAGAGGKTLQLARLIGAQGSIDAADIRPEALRELATRATRAGLRVVTDETLATTPSTSLSPSAPQFAQLCVLTRPSEAMYDGVLVDAPCSGSGTWRRAPHLKWTTQPAHIEAAAAKQRELLARYAERVRIGGRLIYATCSLSRLENEDVVAAFVAAHPAFTVEPAVRPFSGNQSAYGLTFLPSHHDSDGFFVAVLRRSA